MLANQVRTYGGSFLSGDVYFLSKKRLGVYRAEARIETIGGGTSARRLNAFVEREVRRRMNAAVKRFPAHPPREWTLFFDTRTTSWDPAIVSSLTTIRLNEAHETAFAAAFGPKGRLRFRDLLRPGTNPVASFQQAIGARPLSAMDAFFTTDKGVTWIVNGKSKPTYLKAKWSDIPGALPRYGGKIRPGEPCAWVRGWVEVYGGPEWGVGRTYLTLRRRSAKGGRRDVARRRIDGSVYAYRFDEFFRLPKARAADRFEIVAEYESGGRVRQRSAPVPVQSPGWAKERNLLTLPLRR